MIVKVKSKLISVFIPFKLTENGLEVWMQTRHEQGPLDGLLEFPGGKIEAGEAPKEAALREFFEETLVKKNDLRLDRVKVTAFKNYAYDYPDRSVTLFTFVGLMPDEALDRKGWHQIDFDCPLAGIEDKILAANRELIKDLSLYFHELVEDGSWSELWAPL